MQSATRRLQRLVGFLSCSLIGKTPFFGNGLYQFESGQLRSLAIRITAKAGAATSSEYSYANRYAVVTNEVSTSATTKVAA